MSRTMSWSAGTLAGAVGLLAAAAAVAPAALATPVSSSPCVTAADQRHVTCTYGASGGPQTLVVPAGVTALDVVAVGGVGGHGVTPADLAKPAKVSGTLAVTPGQTLFVMVGGNGGDASTAADGDTAPGGTPGWNGGAWGGQAETAPGGTAQSGAGGGGASDVRTVAEDQPDTLDSRLLVAAGSGGGSVLREGGWGDLNGWTAYGASAAAMGTTTGGGAAGDLWSWFGSDGGYGVGGTGRGMPAGAGDAGGGGGGGVYGGGGGATLSSGAGGGSLAPEGGDKGWSDDDHGSVVVEYTLPAPLVVPPPVVQPEPEQPTVTTPAPTATTTTAPAPAPSTPADDGAARARVADAHIVPGSQQTITGTGFTPGETVHGILHSRTVDLGTAVADPDGVVTFHVTLPDGFEIGAHSAVLTGATSGRVATVDFVVAAPSDGASTGPRLAYTGASVGLPLAGGLGALVLGTGITLLARRRRAHG